MMIFLLSKVHPPAAVTHLILNPLGQYSHPGVSCGQAAFELGQLSHQQPAELVVPQDDDAQHVLLQET
jgi:hypothetical protein